MSLSNVLARLDLELSSLVGQWNGYSTGIATALVLILTYAAMNRVEAEIHPMLLARQAQGSPVRQEGESPVYRGNSAPHGLPLNTGLNIKEPGASKWSQGRDGDLRDVWRRAVSGPPEGEGAKGTGRILTVLGSEKVVEHKLDDITRQIRLVGQHIASQGGSKVAIYLPNSVEFIATLFACSFYNLSAILLPYNVPEAEVISMLQRSGADTVVTAPGAFPFDSVVKSYPALRHLIWVVDEGSQHLDWNEIPKGMGGSVNVSTWQDILQDNPPTAAAELPEPGDKSEIKDVIFFWQYKPGTLEEMVRLTQANLVSAISAQLTAVPVKARLSQSDLFLPAAPLSGSHTLVLTLTALFANASVAFNSVAGPSPDLALATSGISPTVVVATPQTLLKTHGETKGKITSLITQLSHWVQTRTLVQDGAMPIASFLSGYNDNLRPNLGNTPGKLRLVYVGEAIGTETPLLSELVLSDLRIFTGSRVIYALTAPKVAGAVTQTQYHDYRIQDDGTGSHFGPPVSSTEILLKDSPKHKVTDVNYTGEIVVRGPAVAGGEAALGIDGTMRVDNCLAYAPGVKK
ncbi:putative amp-dependent synthetase ligase protein [Eutypa lata UCREL1]|uniref:Putative amp-dependent synthetase ligase protein n=1 Tax=Eutypa lata (strain UCR-EL1) TaxID=1287681 RepID=M7TRC7_EUTLA|nr:putative amp-dependent synthetase ligase protein [Eutypa lata UCREL1]